MTTTEKEVYYTAKELAKQHKISRPTIMNWIHSDKLEATKLGGRYRISQTQWDKFVASQNQKSATDYLILRQLEPGLMIVEEWAKWTAKTLPNDEGEVIMSQPRCEAYIALKRDVEPLVGWHRYERHEILSTSAAYSTAINYLSAVLLDGE